VPLVCVLLSKILLLFNYLLSRVHSSFIHLYSYILYFTLYLCYLLIAVCFFFLSCVYVCEKVWCVYSTFFLFFLLPLFISQNSITIFLCFFYISRPSHYARHRLRPVTIDVAWSLCLSVGYNREPWQKRMNRQHAVWVLDSWLVPGTMPYMAPRMP